MIITRKLSLRICFMQFNMQEKIVILTKVEGVRGARAINLVTCLLVLHTVATQLTHMGWLIVAKETLKRWYSQIKGVNIGICNVAM